MLVKKFRLTKDKDFKKVFKLGKSFSSRMFKVKTSINGFKFNRYGIVISTKVSKKAVVRNKLKRQIRTIIKNFDKEINNGVDLVIIVSPATLNQKYAFIKSEIERSLFTLKLFKTKK